jgi:methylated-DNA-[protein]-cysteine S-methyltransferase
MVNTNSAIALYGLHELPLKFEAEAHDQGIRLVLVPPQMERTNLGSQLRRLVNISSALLIFNYDKKIHSLVQFYFAANKNVYFASEEDAVIPELPKGIKNIKHNESCILTELVKETEKAVIETLIGKFELRFNAFGLSYLKKSKSENADENPNKNARKVQTQLNAYFEGKRKHFNLKVFLKGTPFQRKVWTALSKIPYGNTLSYGDLATQLGDKKASRAVGLANSKNPIWIVIPCHRVLSKEGELTGYAGGLKLKQMLLDIESQQMSLF